MIMNKKGIGSIGIVSIIFLVILVIYLILWFLSSLNIFGYQFFGLQQIFAEVNFYFIFAVFLFFQGFIVYAFFYFIKYGIKGLTNLKNSFFNLNNKITKHLNSRF